MLHVQGPSIAEMCSVWATCWHFPLEWPTTCSRWKHDGGDPQISELLRLKFWAFVRFGS